MKFNGLTNEGIKYLAKIQANQNAVTFSKIVIGDGRLDDHDNPAELTSLINKKTEKGIITKEQNGDTVTLLTYIDNVSLSQGYYPREIGIYVNDNGMEKLYYYMNDGDETSWIPPESYGPFKIELKLNIIASNANSIIVNNYAKSMYVTKEYVDALNSAKLDKGEYTGTAKTLDDKGLYPRNTLSRTVNLDNVTQQGLYDCSNLDKSSFAGYNGNHYPFGTFEVLVDNAGNITQKYIPHRYTGNILIRQKYHSSIWEEWRAYESSNAIDRRVGTLPASVDTSEKIFKALQGNVGIKFDEHLLYLNDTGTKRVGYCYLDKLKDGIFECISTTTSTVNNSSFFKNLSNKENSDRLDNLFSFPNILKNKNGTGIYVGNKGAGNGNYIDVSSIFKKVHTAIFTSFFVGLAIENNCIYSYQGTTNDLKVMYHGIQFHSDGTFKKRIYSETPDNINYYGSCAFVIFGELL